MKFRSPQDIRLHMEQNNLQEIEVYGTSFYRRKITSNILRDFPPYLFRFTTDMRHPQCINPNRIRSSSWEGNARGDELAYFTTLEEAVDHYNQRLDEYISWALPAIQKIERASQLMEARRIGR